ncbi:MAG: dihydropteroate synthase [Candidatus Nanopelagicales bacterium]
MEIFGILNVTPDSFSDGGRFVDIDTAIAHARAMRKAGASVIDVGGESTRPGAAMISSEEEINRIAPIVKILINEGFRVSLDTSKAKVAEVGLELGVHYINDVTGGLGDSDMLSLLASSDVEVILMHWRGRSDVMDSLAHYDNVLQDLMTELQSRLDAADQVGIQRERIILDPGFGFAKESQHNWEILANIDLLQELHPRILLGASRKRFLQDVILVDDEAHRDFVTATISGYAYTWNVWGVRVHNVAMTDQALRTLTRIDEVAL